VTLQLAVFVAPVGVNAHGFPLKLPVPSLVKETFPVGVPAVPVTVAVQLVESPGIAKAGVQLTVVVDEGIACRRAWYGRRTASR
jgi:hypothetical protein